MRGAHRLGDLIPFPALVDDRIVLVACRFETGQRIRVAGAGSGWSQEWGRLAVSALDRGLRGVELDLLDADGLESAQKVEIQIHSIAVPEAVGPSGLGDAYSECDVSVDENAAGQIRGVLVGSEIRIRRARRDLLGERRDASAEEWVGALMHEIAHALGFVGHAAVGDSILVREQSRLRAAGRRALGGRPWLDETLEALYQIPTGQRLGERRIKAESASTIQMLARMRETLSMQGPQSFVVRSSVGDLEARIQWRFEDGSRIGIRLPHWRDELRGGGEISLVADAQMLQRMVRRTSDSRSLVD